LRTNSGPLSGGGETHTVIWEWDGTNAVMVSINGVVRKPGAIAVYQNSEGKIALTMADGKVADCVGTGPLADGFGSAASLAGKSFT